MIPGDEHKSMSLMEYITDAPRDVEPYIEYLIADQIAHRDASWSKPEPQRSERERASTQECVRYQIDSHIMHLQDILLKLRRERREGSK